MTTLATKVPNTTVDPPPYTDADVAEVASIFGECEAHYRLLLESKVRGNQFVEGDLDAAAAELGYIDVERKHHSAACSDANLICTVFERVREAKAKLPALVARVEEIRHHNWDYPPLNRADKYKQEQLLSDAVADRDEQREIATEISRYGYLIDQCIDPRVFGELHTAMESLQKARDRHAELKRALRPAVRVESVGVVAGNESYSTKRNVPLDAHYWERIAKYADRETAAGEREYQHAERELLRLKKAERQLAENALSIDQLQELVAELERRPLRPAFFRM